MAIDDRNNNYIGWKDEKTELIERAISNTLNILKVNKEGNVQTTEGTKLEMSLRILLGCLEFTSLSYQDIDVKYGLLYKSVFQLKLHNNQDIYELANILNNEVALFLARPLEKFQVIFPLHVVGGDVNNYRTFEIFGKQMGVSTWDSLRDQVDLSEFFDKAKIHLYKESISLQTAFTPIVMTAEGRGISDAFSSSERIFDLFRIILNLLSTHNHFYQQWGGLPTALAVVLPPPVYGVFNNSGMLEEMPYALSKYPAYKQNNFDKNFFDASIKLAGFIRKPLDDNDTMNIFIDALEMYGRAIDTNETRLSFLFFWQILEKLTLKTNSLPEKEVINRVSEILNFDQTHNDYLLVMYHSRNSLIHESHFPEDNHFAINEVGHIKSIIDIFIEKMFDIVVKYPSLDKLSEYYRSINSTKLKKSK